MLVTRDIKTGVTGIDVSVFRRTSPPKKAEELDDEIFHTDEPYSVIIHKHLGVIMQDENIIVSYTDWCRITVTFRETACALAFMTRLSEEVVR